MLDGAVYEDEAQRYVRARALDDARRVFGYELLVAEEDDRLVACMGYMPRGLELAEHGGIMAIRLQVLAIATRDQGRVLEGGRRLSDALMQTLIARAAPQSVDGVLTAIVARDNLRSIKLCERNGFVSQIAHGIKYVQMLGRFGTGPFSVD